MKRIILSIAIATLLPSGVVHALTPSSLGAPTGLEVVGEPAPRTVRATQWNRVPQRRTRAWAHFKSRVGDWRALWDDNTEVPLRLYGKGIHAPSTVASAQAAAKHARAFLAEHIDLLAPGSAASDFHVVSNEVHRGLRTVGFEQRWHGLRVLGGQVAFQYKNDRLFVISSEALPGITARYAPPQLDGSRVRQVARDWMLQDTAAVAAPRAEVDGPMILPIIRGKRIQYRTVVKAKVDTSRPFGDWNVYVDAYTGKAVARENTLRFGTGAVLYNVPVRRPDDARANYPAPFLDVGIGAGSATSDESGIVSWVGDTSIQVNLAVGGPLVGVANDDGDDATTSLTLNPGGQVVWNASSDELVDAQLASYVHAHIVKKYARRFAPDLAWLDEKLPVNVNIADKCNAFSDGNAINFFQSSDQCANTGRLADVVYHEFGHSLHSNSIISGQGAFEGAFSEGLSDYLATTITGDSGMGRGFFYGDDPLREVDPDDKEHSWPDDVGEIHYTGLIFAGAMWDLRKGLIEEYGESNGIARADELFYAAVQSAADIPSSYVAVLAEDDDDGDLGNGTPNACLINATFGQHGLRALGAEIVGLAAEQPSPDGHPVTVTLSGLFASCPGDAVVKAELVYNRSGEDDSETIVLEDLGENVFTGLIPTPSEAGVVEYRLLVEFADGNVRAFPDNRADPKYQFYVGDLVELYCTDFEQDPFEQGWGNGLSSGEETEGANDWQWGAPQGVTSSGDPAAAYSGANVIGNDLGGADFNGKYQASKTNFALSPAIAIERWSDVRLQYRRWLNVEDGFFDKATIYVGDFRAWQNYDSDQGNQSTVHHRDKEWRFHDVALSPFITGDSVQVKFEISSDAGLEFGGWTIDDFCIVADANSVCGDGKLSGAEQCDDGVGNSNAIAGACRENCRLAGCGDGILDASEQCDDGNAADGDGCSASCLVEHSADCGLSVTGRNRRPASGPWALIALLTMGYLWRRRRR